MKNVVLSEAERLVLEDVLKGGVIAALSNHKEEDIKSLCYKTGHGELFEPLLEIHQKLNCFPFTKN